MANLWDDRFGVDDYIYGKEPNLFIKEHANRLKDRQKIAAFAEGEGRNAVYLAARNHLVTSYDISAVGLRKSNQLAERAGVHVETVHKDLIHEPVPSEAFEAAFMTFGQFKKKDQGQVLEKIFSSVKPGGIILLEVYSESQLQYETGGPGSTDMLYNPVDILSYIDRYKVLHFFYGEQYRKEGLFHTGLAHVIQVIIQK